MTRGTIHSADNPLIALPLVFGRTNQPSVSKIDALIGSLHEFVKLCAEEDGSQAAALEVLGDYGRRYEALVYCTVPANEPCILQMSQELPLNISRLHRTEIEAVFNDAASNHISVRMLDPDVEIKRLPARSVTGLEIEDQEFTSIRASREDVAFYGSEIDRPYRVVFRLQLRVSQLSSIIALTILLTTLQAAVLLLTVRPLATDDVALLVVPTTFASGLLLIQQRTTVAAQLQVPLRLGAVLILLTLWCIVGVGFAAGFIRTG